MRDALLGVGFSDKMVCVRVQCWLVLTTLKLQAFKMMMQVRWRIDDLGASGDKADSIKLKINMFNECLL